jgi:hypothetical protein
MMLDWLLKIEQPAFNFFKPRNWPKSKPGREAGLVENLC